jgi:hypothetical protein
LTIRPAEPNRRGASSELHPPRLSTRGPDIAFVYRFRPICHHAAIQCGRTIVKKYIIERELPAVGSLERQALREAAAKSNATLKELGPDIQWVESYVAGDKTFCVYLAKDEAIIQEHARRSGFPANKVTEIRRMIDPTTAEA